MLTATAVTAPASTYDLTVLATVRGELGLTDRAEDENLARWIKQASGVIAKYCNRVFAQETLSDTFRLKWRECEETLVLSRFPVSSIVSILENYATLDPTSDYELSPLSGAITRLHCDRPWHWYYGKVTVTYVAGYASVNDLPFEIQRAAVLLVKSYREMVDREAFLRSEDVPGVRSVSYQDVPMGFDFPPEVLSLLENSRKPAGQG